MAALLAATRRLLKMSTGAPAATATAAARTVAAASTSPSPAANAAADAAAADADASSSVAAALRAVRVRASAAASRANRDPAKVRVVAVSKTKPVEALAEAYACGQRDFGENYVQELLEKAPALPPDVRWRFIGHLQGNKARALVVGVPGLVAVETVDSAKLADRLDAAVAAARGGGAGSGGGATAGAGASAAGASGAGAEGAPSSSPSARLDVFVQVNTSGEESKHGVEPGEPCVSLARHVSARCPHLRLAGLMTIGQPDYSSRPENFERLNACRGDVAAALGVEAQGLELSMGMSGDFEQAVEMGSTNVRVGSTIFGARDYSAKK
jgi:PLP dependent protein